MTKEADDCYKALQCLYIAVEYNVADDVNTKVKTLIEQQAQRIEDLELGLDIALLQQANEIGELKTKLTYAEDAAAKGDKARLCIAGCEQENKDLREALDFALVNFDWTSKDGGLPLYNKAKALSSAKAEVGG